jgi:hypothetical protein
VSYRSESLLILFCSGTSSTIVQVQTQTANVAPTSSPDMPNYNKAPSTSSAAASSHSKAGIIAGAVIGFTVVLLALLGALILYKRRTGHSLQDGPGPGQSQSPSRANLANVFRLKLPLGLGFGGRSRVSFHRDLMVRESTSQSTSQQGRVEEGRGGRARAQSMSNSSVAGTELSISTMSSSGASPTVESGYGYGYEPDYHPEKGADGGVRAGASEKNWQSGWYDLKETGP